MTCFNKQMQLIAQRGVTFNPKVNTRHRKRRCKL